MVNTSQISQNARHPETIVYDKAQFSRKELRDLQAKILADQGKLRSQGVELADIGEKTSLNKLIADVVSTTSAKTSVANTVFSQLYGSSAISVHAVSARPTLVNRAGGLPYEDGY